MLVFVLVVRSPNPLAAPQQRIDGGPARLYHLQQSVLAEGSPFIVAAVRFEVDIALAYSGH